MASRGTESWCRARTVQTIRPQQSVPAVRDNRPPDVSTKRRMFWWGTRDANEVWLPTGGSVMALRAFKGFGKGNLWGFLQGVGGQKKHVWRYCTCYFFSLGINHCGLDFFFPFVLICSYHVPFFSVKQSQGFATCSTALFVQLPGSQLGVFPSNWGAFHGKTRSSQERAMCCVVENYQEEDGVRVPRQY